MIMKIMCVSSCDHHVCVYLETWQQRRQNLKRQREKPQRQKLHWWFHLSLSEKSLII